MRERWNLYNNYCCNGPGVSSTDNKIISYLVLIILEINLKHFRRFKFVAY
jgi:hypothetical protein